MTLNWNGIKLPKDAPALDWNGIVLADASPRPILLSNCVIVGSTIVCDCEAVYQDEAVTFSYDSGPGDLGTVGGVAGDVVSFAEAITNNSTVPVP